MARDNDFVVIQRAKVLEQGLQDVKKEDLRSRLYHVVLWPGKATKKPVVPGEKMRVKFRRSKKSTGMAAHVVLAEELRDVCVGLSTFQGRDRKYRTSGLSCFIKVHAPSYTETPAARDVRERALLEPLQELRHFQSVSIEGTLPAINYQIARQLTHQVFDRGLVLTTIDELLTHGDQTSSTGDHDVAEAQYQRAYEYFHHMYAHERHVFMHPTDFAALEFKIMQHCALNWISAGNFSYALKAATSGLNVANRLFGFDAPMTTGPPTGPDGPIPTIAFRKRTWECIREGAARYGQKIKAEDMGRCYYYKSISERVMYGDEAKEEVEEDKSNGIGCCVVSDTMRDNVPAELLRLETRTMEKLAGGCREKRGEEGEGEDEDEDEDKGLKGNVGCTCFLRERSGEIPLE